MNNKKKKRKLVLKLKDKQTWINKKATFLQINESLDLKLVFS